MKWVIAWVLIMAAVMWLFWRQPRKQQIVRRVPEKVQQERQVPVPEIQDLQTYLDDFRAHEDRWGNLLAMGDIYKAGVYPRYRRNTALALECYRAATLSPDPRIAGLAQAKYMDARMHALLDDANAGDNLPEGLGILACQVAHTRLRRRPVVLSSRPLSQVVVRGLPRPVVPRGDAQNVHDHSVVKVIHQNLKTLETSKTDPECVERVRDCVLNLPDLSPDDKAKALMTLDDLNDKHVHSSFGVTETEALGRAWARIQENKDQTTRKNLEEMLGRQLASAVENGHVVCSTGKISRIVDTFQGITDDLTTTRPMSAVTEELASLASRVREDCLKTCGASDRIAYESGQNATLESDMKNTFKERAIQTYVDGLGMSSEVLSPLIESFMDAF
jgi:hypothetical protein